MTFSRFDEASKKEIAVPALDKQRKILSDLQRKVLVKDLPGNQKASLRVVK